MFALKLFIRRLSRIYLDLASLPKVTGEGGIRNSEFGIRNSEKFLSIYTYFLQSKILRKLKKKNSLKTTVRLQNLVQDLS